MSAAPAHDAPARDLARLHHETVRNSAELAREGRRQRRRKPQRGPRPVVAESTSKLPPEILAAALDLTGGDRSRLLLHKGGTGVTIANSADHRRYLARLPRYR